MDKVQLYINIAAPILCSRMLNNEKKKYWKK